MFYNLLDCLLSLKELPICIPFSFMFWGVKKMKKIIYAETIKDLNKKDLFNYLLEDRIFIESLSYDDIKFYYKFFKKLHKIRMIDNFKQFLKIE